MWPKRLELKELERIVSDRQLIMLNSEVARGEAEVGF
jgi:hypothetical protein